jgi:Uma2 family endonuclease
VPAASFLHSVIGKLILKVLMLYVEPAGLGEVFPDGTGYDLPNGDSVIPDVSYIVADRVPPYDGELTIAPDLAVEVVSPSNTPYEVRKKIASYLESGTQRVWVVYPDDMKVLVHWQHADGITAYRTLGVNDTLTGEDVIPGFSVKVGDIFPQPKANPQAISE